MKGYTHYGRITPNSIEGIAMDNKDMGKLKQIRDGRRESMSLSSSMDRWIAQGCTAAGHEEWRS